MGGVGFCTGNLSKIVPPSGNSFARSLISGASSLISKFKSLGGCIGKGCCIAPSLVSKSSNLAIKPLGSNAGVGATGCTFSNADKRSCSLDGSN